MNIQTETTTKITKHSLTRIIGATLGSAILAFVPIPVCAQSWNAGLDLVLNEKPDVPALSSTELSNPNGKVPEWSYGYRGSIAGIGLTLFANTEHTNAFNGTEALEGWSSPSLALGVPIVLANVSGAPVTVGSSLVNPDELVLHPQGAGPRTFAIVRWTAPTTAKFDITANWRDLHFGNGDGFDAHLVLNGISLFDANLADGQSTADTRSLLLAPGDRLDFVVGPGAFGSNTNDSTGLRVTIVPEPGAIGLVAIGGALLAWRARRKRSNEGANHALQRTAPGGGVARQFTLALARAAAELGSLGSNIQSHAIPVI
jgi:hypothetical protein